MVWQEFHESQIAPSWPRWRQIWQNQSHHGLLIWAKGVPARKGSNGSEQVLKFCGIGEPQTGLRVQSSVQPELWTKLKSSLLGFRFEPKFGTELQQHYCSAVSKSNNSYNSSSSSNDHTADLLKVSTQCFWVKSKSLLIGWGPNAAVRGWLWVCLCDVIVG